MLDERDTFVAQTLARADLYCFARWMMLQRRGYKWQRARHHKTVCDTLMRVYRGELKRVLINIPPRYSKTELAVVNFMAWALGRNPDCEFIHTSYSAMLASTNSWTTRELVDHQAYHAIFPDVELQWDSHAKDHWRTTAGGCVYATGAEGTITGFGAGKVRSGFGGAIIIDDLHKPLDIGSETTRKRAIEWFPGTLESRKNSGETPILIIGQRLHEEDIFGWLLAGGNGEKWTLVCEPAIQPDGTALWEEKHTISELRRMEEASPYTFAGQYMQRPAPAEGAIFKPDKLVRDGDVSGVIQWVRGWDLASLAKAGDWTVGVKIGLKKDRGFVVGDVQRIQGSPDQVESLIVNTAITDGRSVRVSIPQDTGQAGVAQKNYYAKSLQGFVVHFSPETGDKVTRAEPFASQVNVGTVAIVPDQEWNLSYINELRNFPNGKYDDQIDGSSRAFNHLTERRPLVIPPGLGDRIRSMNGISAYA